MDAVLDVPDVQPVRGEAGFEGGGQFWKASSGRWAGEQIIKAMMEGKANAFSPESLRVGGVLRRDEWIEIDTALIEAAQIRLVGIADLIAAGLTKPIANSMGKTVLEYERIGEMSDASVSLDGMVRTETDIAEYSSDQLPLPITHKDFFINLRKLAASRNRGESLDTTQGRMAGRKVGEKQEEMLFVGGKTFGGLRIYGYTTHPNRLTASFGTNGSWAAAAKTGDQIFTDTGTLIGLLEAQKMYGPYWMYTSRNMNMKLQGDYKATGDKTIRQRLMDIGNITKISTADKLPADNVLLVQATEDNVQLVQGEPLQTIQWDIEGGFGVNFKAFQIQVPLIRAIAGRSGIAHMA